MNYEDRKYQTDAVDSIRTRFRQGMKRVGLMLPTGAGKCLGAGTPILMSDGSIKKVENIKIDDKIIGPDGSIKTVLSLGRGHGKLYRVVPMKGDSYVCNKEHILCLKKTNTTDRIALFNGKIIENEESIVDVNVEVFMNSSSSAKHLLKGWRSEAIEFSKNEQVLKIPPYIVGVYLGDGTSRMPSITKPKCNLTKEWVKWGESLGCHLRINNANGTRCDSWSLVTKRGKTNPVLNILRKECIETRKFIPQNYLTGSINQRLELLAGLLDSDGHYSNGGYDWITKEKKLSDDFAFLCRSVGLSAYVKKCKKRIKSLNFEGTYYRCSVSGDCERIPCKDKKAEKRLQKKRHLVHGIKIEDAGYGNWFGFELDGDGRFLLGDFTVTHNTRIGQMMIDPAVRSGKRVYFICDRLSLIDQTAKRFYDDGFSFGILQGNNSMNRPSENLQICSIQTLKNRAVLPADFCIVDEFHTAYKHQFELMQKWDSSYWVGLSATPWTKGLGLHWQTLVTGPSMGQLMREGYLSNYRAILGKVMPDMEGVKKQAGDFNMKTAGERMDKKVLIEDIVETWLELADNRKTMVFATNVAHAKEITEKFIAAGVTAKKVDCYMERNGESPQRVIREFKENEFKVLVSVDMVVKGFDVTDVECLSIARPTCSLIWHIQALGRGLRAHEGKGHCLILDHAGNIERLDCFPDDPLPDELDDGKVKKKIVKARPPKPCPKCRTLFRGKKCPSCGYEREGDLRKSHVKIIRGAMVEVSRNGKEDKKEKKYTTEDKRKWYAMFLSEQKRLGKSNSWLLAQYKSKFDVWPRNMEGVKAEPANEAVLNWLKYQRIKWIKSKKSG